MIYGEEQRYWIWLSSITGVGAVSFDLLMQEYGSAKYVWQQQILAKRLLKKQVYESLKKACSD